MVPDNQKDTTTISFSDIMLLSEVGLENAVVKEMITKAKKKYVDTRHTQKISQMHSATYKNGWWKTYVYVDGKRKEVVRKTDEELYSALYDIYRAQEEAPKTFSDAVELLLMKRKYEQLNRSYNTIIDNRRYFSYLNDSIQNKPLCEITEDDLRRWLKREFMPTRPKETSLRKVLQLLKELFRFSTSMKLCNSNPAEYLLVDDYVKDCDLSRKKDEERAFFEAELTVLKEDAEKTPLNPRSLMTLLAMETGMRAGELAALHQSDIEDGFIHVYRQQLRDKSDGQQSFIEVGYTEDERKRLHDGRYVPITNACAEVIELTEQLPGESEYVFHDKNGDPIAKDSYEQNLRRRCERLGIKTTHNHAFRVAFNGRLIDLGFGAADRALLLGHAVETNERHYSRSDRRRLDDIRQRLTPLED